MCVAHSHYHHHRSKLLDNGLITVLVFAREFINNFYLYLFEIDVVATFVLP